MDQATVRRAIQTDGKVVLARRDARDAEAAVGIGLDEPVMQRIEPGSPFLRGPPGIAPARPPIESFGGQRWRRLDPRPPRDEVCQREVIVEFARRLTLEGQLSDDLRPFAAELNSNRFTGPRPQRQRLARLQRRIDRKVQKWTHSAGNRRHALKSK